MKKIFDIRSNEIQLTSGFWKNQEEKNLKALLHQWAMLEEKGTINNFRYVINKRKRNRRETFFYSDSDFYKWIEAASYQLSLSQKTIDKSDLETKLVKNSLDQISQKLTQAIELVTQAQSDDGYLFTWNQMTPKGKRRWKSLLIEHELYSMAHLIQAGVAHFLSTQEKTLIQAAQKSANLLINSVVASGKIAGHPLLELTFIQLYDLNGNPELIKAAQTLIKQRHHKKYFLFQLLKDFSQYLLYKNSIQVRKISRASAIQLQTGDKSSQKPPKFHRLRFLSMLMDGSYFIAGKSLQSFKPKGHCVRYLYFKAAEAALLNRNPILDQKPSSYPLSVAKNQEYTPKWLLEKQYEELLNRHIHAHGGLGDLPEIGSFHPKFAGNEETAYCESCASIAMIQFSRQMYLLTQEPHYHDVIEWELYNILLGSFNSEGNRYHKSHSLTRNKDKTRIQWHQRACCPSNISTITGSLNQLIYLEKENELFINQYINHQLDIKRTGTWIEMQSKLPFENEVNIHITNQIPRQFRIHLRVPSWAEGYRLYINGKKNDHPEIIMPPLGEGWEPHFINSSYLTIDMDEETESKSIRIIFSDTIRQIDKRASHIENKPHQKAFYRNAMLYCMEEAKNSLIYHKPFIIDLSQPAITLKNDSKNSYTRLQLTTTQGEPVVMIPYGFHSCDTESEHKIWLPCKGGIGDFELY